jgi:hypothetical protein
MTRPKKSAFPTEPEQPDTPSKGSGKRKRPTEIAEVPNDGKTKEAPICVDDETELGENDQLPASELIKPLQLEIDQWGLQIKELEKAVYRTKDDLARADRNTRRRLEVWQRKETDYENLIQECERLSNDNLALREYIHRTRDRQPTYTDEEYITRIQSLNEMTKSWIASLSKSRRSQNLEADQQIISTAFCQTSHGREFAALLSENPDFFEAILKNRQLRNLLVRQLIWSTMADLVFRPFCFGLKESMNDLLNKAMEIIRTQGTVSSHPLY